jgi:VanZ family protein
MPSQAIPEFHWFDLVAFDKWVHAGIFFILVINLRRSLFLTSSVVSKNALYIVLSASILYGGFLELMQFFIFSSRSGEWSDFFANTFGCVTAYYLFPAIIKKFPIIIRS